MKYLFLLLVLTACTAPKASAGTAAADTAAQTDLRPLPEKDYKLFINDLNPYLKEYQEFFDQQLKRYGKNPEGELLVNFPEFKAFASAYSFTVGDSPVEPFDSEYAKQKDEKEIWLEELQAIRKPIADMSIVKRLIKVQDGYNRPRFVVFASNKAVQDLTWYHEIYVDPETQIYYHAKFTQTNIKGLDTLIESKKDRNLEKHSQSRVVFLTNLTPSLWIYADALNNYRLYAAEYKNTVDNYFVFYHYYKRRNMYLPINEVYENIPGDLIKIVATTNRTMNRPVTYHAETNGVPIGSMETNYYWSEKMEKDLTNSVHSDVTDTTYYTYNGGIVKYTPETKVIYYGVKYNYFGDIAELINNKKDFYIGYSEYSGVLGYPINSSLMRESNFLSSSSTDFAREEETGTLTP